MEPEIGSRSRAPSLRLDGQVAVVTGAGRGIGGGCAIALAEAGADVTLMARSRSELEETAREVGAIGQNVQPIVCDVTDSRQVEEVVGFLEEVDILVNNAGTNVPEPFLEVSEKSLDEMLAVNVKGVFLVAQAAARNMVERGESGSIVNISSQMGHVGAPRRTVYCATKHAVEGLTKAMAVELAPHNVRVNSVAPTFVETPMTKPFLENETFRVDTLSRIPLGRLGRVEDVTGAVLFLASPAAGLITGASLLVDGGWTAQ
ncbi:MAG: glucose 1-dehydrogenase [Actinomycetota bacterium]|nr:glucose 1-dehydrogenase [Actinomycetota bacterium]